MNYTISEIALIIKAEDYKFPEKEVSVILTDSRSLTFPEETLFFALVTERNNAHRYIYDLYRKGVRHFVISDDIANKDEMPDANFLKVSDTLVALQQLAAVHRKRFDIPVIGVTGSNGKTIVKEWLYQLLHEDYNMVRSPRSYNSQIGVPLSIWQMNESTELAVIEAGISRPGEMDKLEAIIKPTVGIITNIGGAHQEGFASMQEKSLEKLALFKDSDCIIYNGDSALISDTVEKMCLGTREIAWSYKDKNGPLYIIKVSKEEENTRIRYSYLQYEGEFVIPFVGDAAVENAIHCLAVMLYLGKGPNEITEKMAKLEPVAMRLEVKEGRNNCLVINDTYNSDINSLEIALDFQVRRATAGMRRTLILSDILQSGMLPATLYRKVSQILMHKGVDRLIGIGPEISACEKSFGMDAEFYLTTDSFLNSGATERFNNELILIKGSRDFHFEQISEALELKQHETILEVNLDALIDNFNFYRQKLKPETKIICMVKAFGYGAGSYELAKSLQDRGCDYLAVAVADEGAELRKAGITMPIMVMNPEMNSFRTLFSYSLEPEIYSFKLLKAFSKEAEQLGIMHYPVHIKIDSGMHRLGFTFEDMPLLVNELSAMPSIRARSVFSHFAGSDEARFDDFSLRQIAIFKDCARIIQNVTPFPIMRHILNTAGISRFTDEQMEGVRLGLGLYGISPIGNEPGLRNVSTLKTTILQIKELNADQTVGYSRRGVLSRKSRIAALPIGYADGVDRHLGNGKGYVIINGRQAPYVGNICMDVCMVDVTDIDCQEGDKVEIFGDQLSVCVLAKWLDTIPYEILTSVSSRVKRVYYRE
ncbi:MULTISPECIES: bifunctional UDP-N-acetylmuramoyl-tripeptide:D-alanyl-D-alanine ligase/alanine racemase [Bacteroidales]|jgi:alanine racemase|uniref:bifunctional UDP-N-acetylmuramoyl-tripeptide:D-alanyl-D-alanine ligase/alanine racemase n=1 Tax=Bacteroidales TaxID=171549 RepID=UPI0005750307|nr:MULTISPECIES: bifunctional UDP-N-acetylmuramoyl-tripeptide:D-alanyl-D-alanine ligase/alanine racemase [Bacteroidales]KHM44134.1 UDP-N-acetylmuramoyl-tripeptide--D-alanyl-D-alanine ligase [Coprobacter secundus]